MVPTEPPQSPAQGRGQAYYKGEGLDHHTSTASILVLEDAPEGDARIIRTAVSVCVSIRVCQTCSIRVCQR